MEHRIVQVTQGEKTHFEVQEKWFWRIWNTLNWESISNDGSGSTHYPHEFDTQELAQKHIDNLMCNKVRFIIKSND